MSRHESRAASGIAVASELQDLVPWELAPATGEQAFVDIFCSEISALRSIIV